MDKRCRNRIFVYLLLGHAALAVISGENSTVVVGAQETEEDIEETTESDIITLKPNAPFSRAKCDANKALTCKLQNFNYCTKIPAGSTKDNAAVEACYCSYNKRYYNTETEYQCTVRDVGSSIYDAIKNNKTEYTFYMVMMMFLVMCVYPIFCIFKNMCYGRYSWTTIPVYNNQKRSVP